MRIAVLGAGRMGAVHATNLVALDDVDEVVVADPDVDDVPAGTTRAGTIDDALDRADGVVIVTPTANHPDHVATAVAAGVPIFCEKPISLDLETTRATLDHVVAAGVELQIGFQRRSDAGFLEMRRLVETGALGRVLVVRAGSHDHEPPHESYLATAGSIFRDMHIHDFDAVPWLVGDEVESVHATGSVLVDEMFERAGDVDTCVAVLRFADGTLAVLTGTRADGVGYDHRTEVIGTADSVSAGFTRRMPLRSADPGGPQPVDPYPSFPVRFADAYRSEMRAFVDLVAGRGPNRCPGEAAYDALRLAVAADESLAAGAPVTL